MTRRRQGLIAGAVLALTALAVASPHLAGRWWAWRSSNPVRRGMARAAELGCFHCHGWRGRGGIASPDKRSARVPGWADGEWTTYVVDEQEVREYILDGYAGDPEGAAAARHRDDDAATIRMPAYRDVLRGTDLEDLVAAFKVLAGMTHPPSGSAARRGLEVAVRWDCFSCHGPAGAGGPANPGSLTGFIPGWYGPGFNELVRDRREFDTWIREGSLPRMEGNPLAAYFLRRQRVSMPAYPALTPEQLDNLWSYRGWLERTGGGHGPDTEREDPAAGGVR